MEEIDGDRVKRESERSICSSSDLERERGLPKEK
jgi:hypothetical protein